jgi:alkanesulfonate monooxygenase
MSPSVAARMAATFDRMSGGRLIVNVVGGGDPVELAGDGLFLDHDARYQLMDEFLCIWKELVQGHEFTFTGKYLSVTKGNVVFPCLQQLHPPLFLGGSSASARRIAVDHVDTYLTWGEPPAQVSEKLRAVTAAAADRGKQIEFGIRLHLIVRNTDEEAWAAADDLIRFVDDDKIAQAQAVLARSQSEGQRRMNALHRGSKANLEVSPNLWSGVALVTGGAGTALVGSSETVAQRLKEYAEMGIRTFILSGYPHLEEAYRVAELLFPLLPIDRDRAAERPLRQMAARVIPGGCRATWKTGPLTT